MSTCRKLRVSSLAALFACLMFTLLSAPIGAQIRAVDGRGITIDLPSVPKRIVSIAPSITEILFSLGLPGRIVADTSQCNYPPEATKLPHIGDYRISIEQVIAMKPDLVVAVTSANRSAIQQLERLRVPVFSVDPGGIEETMDAIRRIGQITGTDPKANRVIAGMKLRVSQIRKLMAGVRQKPKVLIVIQSQPLMVVGSKTFIDEIVTSAGGENLGRKSGAGYNLYSSERVIADPPDLIIGTAEIGSKPGWSGIPAVKNHKVLRPPPDILSRAGPRLLDALEFMARALHPELFRSTGASSGIAR